MTDTGDFRRYSYSSDASYALKAFNAQRSSAAPAYSPKRDKELKVRENGKKSKKSLSQLKREQRIGFVQIVKIAVVAALCLAMFFAVIYTYAEKNELTHQISDMETQLAVAESENTRINSELNSLVSMSMIDRYAVEELGMTKMKSNQIRYIDVSQYKQKRAAAAEQVLKTENVKSKAAK